MGCTGRSDDHATPAPPHAAPAPPPAKVAPAPAPAEPDGPPPEETPPAGGWIQDEVIYDAQGDVYGCVGGGNWCANSPRRDPKTHKPRR
jgi:hypothetical protein